MTPFRLTYGLSSIKGTIHETNQDVAAARLFKPAWSEGDVGLFVVADGGGVKGGGERAAQIAVDTVIEAVAEAMSRDVANVNFGELLTEAYKRANDIILEERPDGVATLATVLMVDDRLFAAHAGDTRIYKVSDSLPMQVYDSKPLQLTEDHCLVLHIPETSTISPADADYEPRIGRVLFNAIGGQIETLRVDLVIKAMWLRGVLLLCSDGLTNLEHEYIENSELQAILQNNDPQTASDKLVMLARERGSTDDITALVVRVA